MTDYLLDTHVLLWTIFSSDKLSKLSRHIIMDKNSRKFISISTLWEISIKNRIGKLPLPGGITGIFTEVESNGFGIMGVNRQHIETYGNLPLLHRDPFDGIIVATAIFEQMTIVTADENIHRYNVQWAW